MPHSLCVWWVLRCLSGALVAVEDRSSGAAIVASLFDAFVITWRRGGGAASGWGGATTSWAPVTASDFEEFASRTALEPGSRAVLHVSAAQFYVHMSGCDTLRAHSRCGMPCPNRSRCRQYGGCGFVRHVHCDTAGCVFMVVAMID